MILPWGHDLPVETLTDVSTQNSCNQKAKFGGRSCAAKIMGDGWTIKYW